MPTYFILETVTREGMLTVEQAPARAAGVVDAAASFGVTLHEWFYTVGDFDFLMKVDAPDDESVTAFLIALRRSGNVTARLVRAYTPDAWRGLVERLQAG